MEEPCSSCGPFHNANASGHQEMVQEYANLQPGQTTSGKILTQESSGKSIYKKEPVTYDTGGQQDDYAPRHSFRFSSGILRRRNGPDNHQLESSDEPWLPVHSENVSQIGDRRSPPQEILAEENCSQTDDVPTKDVDGIQVPASENLLREGDQPGIPVQPLCVPDIKPGDGPDDYGPFETGTRECKEPPPIEKDRLHESDSHSQTGDVPTKNVDGIQVPASKNLSRVKGDQPGIPVLPLCVPDIRHDEDGPENYRAVEKGTRECKDPLPIEKDRLHESHSHSQTVPTKNVHGIKVPASENLSREGDQPHKPVQPQQKADVKPGDGPDDYGPVETGTRECKEPLPIEEEQLHASHSHSQTGDVPTKNVDGIQVPASENLSRVKGDQPGIPVLPLCVPDIRHDEDGPENYRAVEKGTRECKEPPPIEKDRLHESHSHSQTVPTKNVHGIKVTASENLSRVEGDQPHKPVQPQQKADVKPGDGPDDYGPVETGTRECKEPLPIEEYQLHESHSNTKTVDDIPTDVDHITVQASENLSREGDQPLQDESIPSLSECCKFVFIILVILVLLFGSLCISIALGGLDPGEPPPIEKDQLHASHSNTRTDDVPNHIDHITVHASNVSREGDQPRQDESFPTGEVHSGKRELVFTKEIDKHVQVPQHMLDIKPGDLVAIQRFWGLYSHHAIYVGDGYVVHRTGGINDWLCLRKGMIKKEKLADVIRPRDDVRVENGTWQGEEPLPIEEIICRAESNIGDKGFNLLYNNCEHFARWCRYGKAVSRQADNLLFILQCIFNEYVLFVLLVVIGLVLLRLLLKQN